MSGKPQQTVARRVLRYLSDRGRGQQGGWISVADLRAALGVGPDEVKEACLGLHERELVELMGGFPIHATTEGFTLVRLSPLGVSTAADPRLTESMLGDV